MENKIDWCRKKELRLINPNDNLAEEYFSNAEETLRVMNRILDTGSNMWLATQKYYTLYFAAYSLLMRIGIKSEIHSCTIEVIRLLERQKILLFDFSAELEETKELRIQNQYYLKNIPVEIEPTHLRNLILKVRDTLDKLTPSEISLVREMIEK